MSKFNSFPPPKPKILVAPLDWGLGHATRCIPIIRNLKSLGYEVIIAGEGAQRRLLEQEFPLDRFVELRGYRVRYGKNRWLTIMKISLQIPKILIQINRENRWLKQFVRQEAPAAVIADNRYGLHNPQLRSILITHQLSIRTPLGTLVSLLLRHLNYRFIRPFDACWVPDYPQVFHSLAGTLSHPAKLPETTLRYIGPLSRFEAPHRVAHDIDLLVLLSGAEPQRTVLEKILLGQLASHPGRVFFLRGLPGEGALPEAPPGVTLCNHLDSAGLQELICRSRLVISRSGYSTVMDLVRLGCKSILIPTPGQSEQEYLSSYLFGKKIAYQAKQESFSLSRALAGAEAFPYAMAPWDHQVLLTAAMEELDLELRQGASGTGRK